jgi:hypothetical protein
VSAPNLLNKLTVYGSMIENVCVVLREHGPLRADALKAYVLVQPAEGGIEAELLPYMLDVGLIEVEAADGADDYPTYRLSAPPAPGALQPGWSVRLNLLGHLQAMDGVNAMILDLHGYLLQRDEYAGRWLDYKAVYPAYNRDRVGRSTGEVAYNENKMRSWLRVMSYVGLIQPERSNSFVLAPRLDLVRELLAVAQAGLADGDADWPLGEGIAYLEATFCRVTSNPGRLHRGFADALFYLEERGELHLRSFGDAEMISLAGKGQYSHAKIRQDLQD